ncbi:MAG TPA: acyltransferase [Mycobacteriales bacterium]|nr:acyltransferase [Mycobacteriales bacterium]
MRGRARRALFVARIRRTAKRVGSTVELHLEPDLEVGREIEVKVMPGTHTYVRLGPGSRIEDRVMLMLYGGRLEGGPRIGFRRDVIVNVTGLLRMDGDNTLSWNAILHCSNDVHLEEMAGVAEQATVADSSHFFTTPDEHFWHNVRKGSVRIGRNTWICPKVTVTRNADIGSHCIVAAGSVVIGTVPDGHMASGVPATCKPMPLPWRATAT